MKTQLQKLNKFQWILIAVIVILLCLFIFREQVFENKIAKAKMDIFNTILQDHPDTAKQNIKMILDTLVNQ